MIDFAVFDPGPASTGMSGSSGIVRVGSPGTDPASVGTRVAHYRSSDLVLANGANVVSWAPHDGIGPTLTPPGTAPIFATGGLNGKPRVRFAGTRGLTGAGISGSVFTVFVVCSHCTSQGFPVAQWDVSAGHRQWAIEVVTTTSVRAEVSASGVAVSSTGTDGIVANQGFLATGKFDAALASFWLNGVGLQTVASAVSAVTAALALGCSSAELTNALNGDVYEVVVYNSALGQATIDGIEAFLGALYGTN